MADATPTSGAPSSNRTVMLVLAYLGLLALVPLLVEKDDREVQWHAKHGLVLFIAEIVFFVGLNIVIYILGFIAGCLAIFMGPLLGVGILILHIMCILKALKGERLIIPGISEYANRF